MLLVSPDDAALGINGLDREESSPLLQTREFIEMSRTNLDLEREWKNGVCKVKDLERQMKVRQRKRQEDMKRLEEKTKNRISVSA